MRGLRKVLTPFAPDQSGAESVLYELGGMIVILDAGGCAGNICGFDEPRWLSRKSAVFSAGLRDMDAILGRDDKLIEKLRLATLQIDVSFTAIIGTPVPAVIATDFRALRRMAEKATGLKCISVPCTGTEYYDVGEEKAWSEIFAAFAVEKYPVKNGRTGIIGATPLETSMISSDSMISECAKAGISDPVFYGLGSGLENIEKASESEKNLSLLEKELSFFDEIEKLKGESENITFGLTESEKKLCAAQENAASLKEQLENEQKDFENQQILWKRVRELDVKITSEQKNFIEAKNRKSSAENALYESEKKIASLTEKIAGLETSLSEVEKYLCENKNDAKISEAAAKIGALKNSFNQAKNSASSFLKQKSSLEAELSKVILQKEEGEEELKKIEKSFCKKKKVRKN